MDWVFSIKKPPGLGWREGIRAEINVHRNCAQQFDCTSVQPSQPLWTDFKGIAIQLLRSVYILLFCFVNAFPNFIDQLFKIFR